ncbi:MAG: MBL fold metallo-hydrolase [Saprospiraceae bacterium]
MKLLFLGTGTSQGIPVVGCPCSTCHSTDPRDRRLRSSVFIEANGRKFLIDTSPDLRQQLLTHLITDVDAILFTHEHNDHTAGLDDVRPINFLQQKSIAAYASARVINDLTIRYPYVFGTNHYPGSPRVELHEMVAGHSLDIAGCSILPLAVEHGNLPILGFKIGELAYITDASSLPESTIDAIRGVKVLVINALQLAPHHAHFNLDQAVAMAANIGAEKTYLTHMSHQLGPVDQWAPTLPFGVEAASDGLVVTI